jgi:O-antigen/teichoic acid export membrane protein
VIAWTGDATMADQMHAIVAIVTVGTALNGLMNIPYALQLAHGWTRLSAWTNFVALLVLVPLVYYLTVRFGRTGAAAGWAILNAGYVTFGVHFQHRRLLKHELWKWYADDTALPLLGALLAAVPLRLMLAPATERAQAFFWIVVASTTAYVGAGLAAPRVRTTSFRAVLQLLRASA